MKIKTTRKAIVNSFGNVKCAGYCDLSFLLRNHQPVAYTCGVYGWNFDVYDVYGVTICTGYRNMPGKRAKNMAEYEAKATAVLDNYKAPYEERCTAIEELLEEFCTIARRVGIRTEE